MSVLKNARGHFRDQLAGDLNKIEVPEWETTIYFKNISTFAQEQKVLELHAKGELVAALVETLIQKALDKDGKNLFKQADKDVLMREVDPNIIIRICTELNAAKDAASGTLGN
jgi:hypothetical protein